MNARLLIATAMLATLSLVAPGATRSAAGDSTAVAFLKPYVQWAQKQASGPGTYGLDVAYVSNQPNLVCSYAEGQVGSPAYLPFYDDWVVGRFGILIHEQGFETGSSASDDARQYFSDRRWYMSGFLNSFPFNEAATDNTGISLDSLNGKVTVTLDSWGGA